MPDLAQHITIDYAREKMFIDGNEFPWRITKSGPEIGTDPTDATHPTVTVVILADTVEVIPVTETSFAEEN